MKKTSDYYLGLDIGTDSVGAAAINERYEPLKFKGEPIMVSHLFDSANQCDQRRGFRTARRRLDRRQQRVSLVDEIFAPEVIKIDKGFYIRKKESALLSDDKTNKDEKWLYFNNDYTDKEYYAEYPTIHHLISDLINNKDKRFDIRLINIAICWLVAHRGHFLFSVGEDSSAILDFKNIYSEFESIIDQMGIDMPWDLTDIEAFGEILKKKGVNNKKKELTQLLYGGKIPERNDYPIDRKELITFCAGGKVKASKLFPDSAYEDDISFSISDDMETVLPQLGDEAEMIARIANMYDWSILSDLLSGHKYISEAKKEQYDVHKDDLKKLKALVRKYEAQGALKKGTYYEIFRKSDEKLCNYTAYSYNTRSINCQEKRPDKKASKEDFYAFLKKSISAVISTHDSEDEEFINSMKERMEDGSFMPKQVNTDNRVIPYQLYWMEYVKILENASAHYGFLNDKDDDGFSNIEKLKSIFKFKIPYYVGPLVSEDKSKYAWMKRKAEGKIYPWNFEEKVDLNESEQAFIDRMTNNCSYLPGESVIPKWSLLYSRFMVLNEINNIKVNAVSISVEAKQGIYNDLFCRYSKVTPKKIREYLIANGYMEPADMMDGLDITVKSRLRGENEFRNLMNSSVLSSDDVDRIICRRTYTEDNTRFKRWLKEEYPKLSDSDLRYVSGLKYADFGRLSKSFLLNVEGINKETGEAGSIMHFLWNTNDNLMQLLSDRYTFIQEIENIRKEYYEANPLSVTSQLEEMGVSNAVKRPILRTIDVVKDIVSGIGCTPKKIFIEMARGEDKVKKRTSSRMEQILDLYKTVEEDTSMLEKELRSMGDMANNYLQSDALFLYYMQLGKCMYSGEAIDLSQIKSTKYNIDHIYPQSYVKDDSLINNRVLVLSTINGGKDDVYPISQDIRKKMGSYWRMLCDKGLISKEKYSRLIRNTPFTDDEKQGFINRQLVETRQSTKAVSAIFKVMYPDTEIVYVKAGLVADFRQEFLYAKSRLINDLHHAKDAYLNAVVGNVYHERFTKKWFSIHDKYTLNTRPLFGNDIVHGDTIIWKTEKDLNTVKKIYSRNNIHLTRYAYCSKGGLFDQNPIKSKEGLVSLKKGMDTERYGGYNKPSASFFVLVKYKKGGKDEISFVPVENMAAERFVNDDGFSKAYVEQVLRGLNTKTVSDITFPLGKRKIKIKTMLSIDGYRVWVNGKANGGKIILLSNAESLFLKKEWVEYIKRIERFSDKNSKKRILHDEEHDQLSKEKNMELLMLLTQKLGEPLYLKMPGCQYETLMAGRDKFEKLSFEDQIKVLVNGISLMKTGRAGGCDLSLIGGKSSSGAMTMNASVLSTKIKDLRIIDMSASGIHTRVSENLMEL